MKAEKISGFETFPIEFGRDGNELDGAQATALLTRVGQGVTDLLVLSHGWNNDEADARNLYAALLANLSPLQSTLPAGRSLIVMLVYWPSKRFADEELIPGGAAALTAGGVDAALDATIDLLQKPFGVRNAEDPERVAILEQLRGFSQNLEADPGAQDNFVRLLRSLMPPGVNEEEDVLQEEFFETDGETLLRKLARPFHPRSQAAAGGAASVPQFGGGQAAGGAEGLGNLFSGLKNGARNLLNLSTYYEMKERAGTVGSQGVVDVLRRAQIAAPGLRLHLCGHSFGGRVVAAALAAHRGDDPGSAVRSVVLLQAAFSHWGFAQNYDGHRNGFFRRAFEDHRLAGPMLVTHSANDTAVGLAYPIASRLRNQIASGLGDENDPYGGIGRNGAQKTPETDESEKALRPAGQAYGPLGARGIYNLEGGSFITGHSTVTGPEIAHALWTVIRG